MVAGTKMRLPPSGPYIRGENIGDVLTWDGTKWVPGPGGGGGSNPKPFTSFLYIDPSFLGSTPNGAVPSGDNTTGPYTGLENAIASIGDQAIYWFMNVGLQSVAPATLPAGSVAVLQGENGFGDIDIASGGGGGILAIGTVVGTVTSPDATDVFGVYSTYGELDIGPNSFMTLLAGATTGVVRSGAGFNGVCIGGYCQGWVSQGNGSLAISGLPARTGLGSFLLTAGDNLYIDGGAQIETIQSDPSAFVTVRLNGLSCSSVPGGGSACGPISGDLNGLAVYANNFDFTDDITAGNFQSTGGAFSSGRTWTFGINLGTPIIDGATILCNGTDPFTNTINCDSLWLKNLWFNGDPANITWVINNAGGVVIDEQTQALFGLGNLSLYSNPDEVSFIGGRTVLQGAAAGLASGASVTVGPFTLHGDAQLDATPNISFVKTGGGALTNDIAIATNPGIANSLEVRFLRAAGSTGSDGYKLFIKNNSPDTLDVSYQARAYNISVS